MRSPGRKAIYGILCMLLSGVILCFLPPGFMDDLEASIPTLATAMTLFMLGISGLYLLFSGSYRAFRMKSLLAGQGVIASWHVPPDVWTVSERSGSRTPASPSRASGGSISFHGERRRAEG